MRPARRVDTVLDDDRVVVCDRDELRRAAFRLRYLFYAEEVGFLRPADCPDGLYRDQFDDFATILLGYRHGAPVITARVLDGRDHPFDMARFVRVESFLKHPASAEIGRMIASRRAKEFGPDVVARMVAAVLDVCERRAIRYAYFLRRERSIDSAVLNFFKRCGARELEVGLEYEDFGRHRICEVDLESASVAALRRQLARLARRADVPSRRECAG